MDEGSEEEIVLRLAAEELLRTGEWPELRDIHRRIHQDLRVDVDVRSVARRLKPSPFVGGGYHDLGDTFAPSLRDLSRVREGQQLIDATLLFIQYARDK